MKRQDVEALRRGYEAANRRDIGAVIDLLDPEVEWWGHPQLPEPGPLRGRDDVKRWLDQTGDALSEVEVEVEEMIEADDNVVAIVRFRGRGKGSGAPVQGGPDVHVWTMREGKVIAFRWYQGTRALTKLGLESKAR